MAIKSLSEITHDLLNNIHDTLPDVDTKEGTFIRDVFVDPTSSEISALYDEIYMVRLSQSVLTAIGNDLDNLAGNYFIQRKRATPSYGNIRFWIKYPVANDIIISVGTQVSTMGTTTNPALVFETTETRIVSAGYSLQDPTMPDLVYIDIPATSTFTGTTANVEAFTIVKLLDSIDPSITQIQNPLPFSSAIDDESDMSLALRISLAISGSNIGTKDGYASYILKQEEVVDGRVVGAGDPLMTRDQGEGGMVDVYVRAQRPTSSNYTFTTSKEYVTDQANTPAYSDIILPSQPVLDIVQIEGSVPGNTSQKTYEDGTNYLVEKGSLKYYVDFLWDYQAVTASTPTPQDSANQTLDSRLKNINYLTNIFSELSWNFITPSETSTPDPYFLKGINPDDSKVYIIESRNDPTNQYIGGRYFVLNDDQIYERKYYNPDFLLYTDPSDYGYSIKSKDSIRWLAGGVNKPVEGEVLTIQYNYNAVINDLQTGIDSVRVLTADVLVKSTRRVGVEIYAQVVPYSSYDPTVVQASVISRLGSYINNIKSLGGTLDVSDIAYIIRGTDGVDAVGLDTLKLARTNGPSVKQLIATEFEYLETDRIVIIMMPVGSAV